jgi:hypothetical protein
MLTYARHCSTIGVEVRAIPPGKAKDETMTRTSKPSPDESYGIRCYRSSRSVCGSAEAWLKDADGNIKTFDEAEARTEEQRLNDQTYSMNVWYRARPFSEGI